MKTFNSIGVQIPQVWLPRKGIDLQKWAVIACDQFTSQPEYWHEVEKLAADAPSTVNLILPEVYLEKEGKTECIQSIQKHMQQYLDEHLLEPVEGVIYVERQASGKTRRGILLCLDLEQYDYNKGSQSLIRASEGTIIERLPPRMLIREGAPLELPHILILIDDPQDTVIGPLEKNKTAFTRLYDFDLMFGSGHLNGYRVNDQAEAGLINALQSLADPQAFNARYKAGADKKLLLFAVGDGNHSLATAKAIWEKIKARVGMEHPARYALVEIENVHDHGLEFEPIHRVLFGFKKDILSAARQFWKSDLVCKTCKSQAEMITLVKEQAPGRQAIGVVRPGEFEVWEINHPSFNLPVGTLQTFLDRFLKDGGAERIDYVHGEEVVSEKSNQPGNTGFYLPAMDKSDLFNTVVLDGVLPRKTFSMGEAKDKRFYLECRKIA